MGLIHALGAASATATVAIAFLDSDPDATIAILFSFFCMLAELGVQLRWRLSIICPYCGFDPALYLRDAGAAVIKVKEALAAREQNPRTLLSRRPRLQLPKRQSTHLDPGARLLFEMAQKKHAMALIETGSNPQP